MSKWLTEDVEPLSDEDMYEKLEPEDFEDILEDSELLEGLLKHIISKGLSTCPVCSSTVVVPQTPSLEQ